MNEASSGEGAALCHKDLCIPAQMCYDHQLTVQQIDRVVYVASLLEEGKLNGGSIRTLLAKHVQCVDDSA